MTTPTPTTSFAGPAPTQHLERAATALRAHGFTVEILDDAAAARARIKDLIPEGVSVFTGASETLRLSGIDEDINTSGRYEALKARLLAMDRVAQADEIRRLLASPDVIVASASALTETGSLVVASASGSQLPGYAGGAACAIWIVGAQKVVPDASIVNVALPTIHRRLGQLHDAGDGARLPGVFAALLAPAAVSLLHTTFTDRKERGKAFGAFGAERPRSRESTDLPPTRTGHRPQSDPTLPKTQELT
jgi:hypothetical protein